MSTPSSQTPGQPACFEPKEADRATLERIEDLRRQLAAQRSEPETEPCGRTHEPLDFEDFRLTVANVREWHDWPEPGRMAIGECIECSTSVTYPVPAGVKGIDGEQWYELDDPGPQSCGDLAVRCARCGTRYERDSELDLPACCTECAEADALVLDDDIAEACLIAGCDIEGTDDVAWHRIPEATRGALVRYIEHRIPPGSFLRSFLEGDIEQAHARASWTNVAALPSLAYWVYCYAPRESFGSVYAVAAWLEGSH